jgi:hypothetical protein
LTFQPFLLLFSTRAAPFFFFYFLAVLHFFLSLHLLYFSFSLLLAQQPVASIFLSSSFCSSRQGSSGEDGMAGLQGAAARAGQLW